MDGLPSSIRCGSHELLAAPMKFVVETAKGAAAVAGGAPKITKTAPGAVVWETTGKAGAVTAKCTARMEFDVTLRAEKDTPVSDIRLEMPFREDIARYFMGCGRNGGFRPREYEWKWGGPVYYDSFWMGDVPAGVQCELRGASYAGPMVNLYWNLGQLKPPTTWDNGGKGGLTLREEGEKVVATAFSGPRTLAAGEEMKFEFALLITPVKPIDTATHFRTRYYHSYEPPADIKAKGANVINIHHANELNPYINYPFLTTDLLRKYVEAAHKLDMKVKIYYTLRETTNHMVEMPALRSLGHEVLAPGSGGGYPWLREHLGSDYAPSWYQPQPDGEADASIVNSGMSRWYNYYLEGLSWLVEHEGIDGLYQDDVSYDRQIMKRVRKILDRQRPGCMIDLHSNTAFSHGPANQYMEFFPYVDRLWFGESFDYEGSSPDYWLTEISGIPYGLMGEMLQNGGNKWRGMVYGMTARMPWSGDPRGIWKAWDDFGIDKAKMLGYWEPDCPVRTGREDVLATAYVREGKTMIAVASWAKGPVKARLKIDWKALGLEAAKAHLYAPAIEGYQDATLFGAEDAIPMVPGKGWLLVVDHERHDAPAYDWGADDAYTKRALILEDKFAGTKLGDDWHVALSKRPGTRMDVADGKVTITSLAHSIAYARRALPAGTTMVQCRIDTGTDGGMTWGPGLALRWGEKGFLRLNLRTPQAEVGVDDGKDQYLVVEGIHPGTSYYLRLRLEADKIAAEVSSDGEWWLPAKMLPRADYPGDPTEVMLGKMAGNGGDTDADQPPNPEGTCTIGELKVYGAK
jgi:hypothetical protein